MFHYFILKTLELTIILLMRDFIKIYKPYYTSIIVDQYG